MKIRATLGFVLTATCIAPAFAASGSVDDGNIAYDQVTVFAVGAFGPIAQQGASPSTLPSPGSFAAFRALVQNDVKDPNFPPPYGNVVPSIDNFSRLAHGVLLRKSILGKLVRIDDPISGRSTILRPDKGIVVYVDRNTSTYRVLSGDAAKAVLEPPPLALPTDGSLTVATPLATDASSPSPAETGDSETIVMSSQTESADGITIDGVATRGFVTTLKSTPENVTGSCPMVSTVATITKYLDPSRSEPPATSALSAATANALKTLPQLKCHISVQPPPSPAAIAGDKGFVLYQRIDSATTVPLLTTPLKGSIINVRGNVTQLEAKDAALFDTPAGFKEIP